MWKYVDAMNIGFEDIEMNILGKGEE